MIAAALPAPSGSTPATPPGMPGLDVLVIDLDAHVLVCHSEKDTSGRNTSSPPTASAGYLGRKTGRGFRDYS